MGADSLAFESVAYWHWLTLGILLLIIEVMFAGTSFLMWIGFAALATGVVTFVLPLGWEMQFLLFGLASGASVLLWRKFVKDRPVEGGVLLNQRGAEHIGRIVPLEEAIVGGSGRVRLDDTLWGVRGPDMPAGSRVRLVALDGNLFLVSPAE